MSGGPDLRRLAGRAVIGPHDPSPEGAEVLVERGPRGGRRGDGHVTARRAILPGRTAADRLPEAPQDGIDALPGRVEVELTGPAPVVDVDRLRPPRPAGRRPPLR